MKLTRMIFDYWKIWMSVPEETNIWANEVLEEGFCYADGINISFWWVLNREWYRMNHRMLARNDSNYPYIDPEVFEIFDAIN